jgi:hypothetical protein
MTSRTVADRVTPNPPLILLKEQSPQLLDEKLTAAWLGVSVVFLRRGRSCGTTGRRTPTPRFVKIGGRVFYRRSDLEAWVAGLEAREVVS